MDNLSLLNSAAPGAIPLVEAAATAPAAASSEANKILGGATHIFLVDDHEIIRASLRAALKLMPGFKDLKFVDCDDGDRVLPKLGELGPNEKALIILDNDMTRLFGTDTLRLISKNPDSASKIVAIFLNTSQLTDDVRDLANRHIAKTTIPLGFPTQLGEKTSAQVIATYFSQITADLQRRTGETLSNPPAQA